MRALREFSLVTRGMHNKALARPGDTDGGSGGLVFSFKPPILQIFSPLHFGGQLGFGVRQYEVCCGWLSADVHRFYGGLLCHAVPCAN
jgi:hypothetical protein